jgi:hypothetical protein
VDGGGFLLPLSEQVVKARDRDVRIGVCTHLDSPPGKGSGGIRRERKKQIGVGLRQGGPTLKS